MKKTIFVCDACGYETLKWMGKCPRCSGWDTIKEYRIDKTENPSHEKPIVISDEDFAEEKIVLGIDEMDRVLGGGLVSGSPI